MVKEFYPLTRFLWKDADNCCELANFTKLYT